MIKIFVVLFIFFFNPLSFALEESFEQGVLSVLKEVTKKSIQFEKYTNSYFEHKAEKKTALIIVTGVAEPVIKYWQLYNAFKQDYDIYMWDHINQGGSPDILPDIDPKKVYVDNFDAYQTTFNNFLNSINKNYEKINVISHSMGSHIMIKQLLKHPQSIHKLVMITPMIDILKGGAPNWLAKFAMKVFFKETSWAPKQNNKNPDSSYFTSEPKNYINYMGFIKKHKPLWLSTGVTAGWVHRAITSIEQVEKADKSKLKLKIQMHTAGEDRIVKSDAARKFCRELQLCESVHYEKAKHQLLIETDEIRINVYENTKEFFLRPK